MSEPIDDYKDGLAREAAAWNASHVTISRAQLEAYRAAAKVVMDRDSDPKEWMRKRYEALAALRTAGIDLEEKT